MNRDGLRKKQAKIQFQRWRFFFICFAIFSVFCALVARAAYIQIIEPDLAIEENNKRTLRVEKLYAQRGLIVDRNGDQLAVSVPVVSVYADPKMLDRALGKTVLLKVRKEARKAQQDVALAIKQLDDNAAHLAELKQQAYDENTAWLDLAEVLRLPQDEVNEKLVGDPTRRFVYLKRQITPAVAQYIASLKLPGIHLLNESKRYYPAGEVTAHVVGFTNIDGEGIEGIEKLFDTQLTGQDGRRTIRKDAQGREVEVLDERERVNPDTIQLSIDQRIQSLAYRALKSAVLSYKATSGSAVVVDVHTGEVLAMVNSPSFNPNNLATAKPYKSRNRAITDLFEPGSAMKPLSVLAGLEHGEINLESIIATKGWLRVGGSMVWDSSNQGDMDLRTILKKSSNVGVAKIAQTMPKNEFIGFFSKMGFGHETGTGMIGESDGLFTPHGRWSDFEVATLSYGYRMSVSTAQVARAYAALGAGGVLRPLTILKQEQPVEGERVFSEKHAYAVLEMMESVFENGGTAAKVKLDGYRVGAKTGTSKKAAIGGYGDEYVGYFAGVAPVSNPRLAVVVTINEPGGDIYYGGDVAGPAFSEIMAGALRILNVTPDLDAMAALTNGAYHAQYH
jgi:cell division protein FtsI (penicillin-binding protein 3)